MLSYWHMNNRFFWDSTSFHEMSHLISHQVLVEIKSIQAVQVYDNEWQRVKKELEGVSITNAWINETPYFKLWLNQVTD